MPRLKQWLGCGNRNGVCFVSVGECWYYRVQPI